MAMGFAVVTLLYRAAEADMRDIVAELHG